MKAVAKTIISKSLEKTREIGQKIGSKCLGGEIFLLNGDLGAGKTSFLQGLGEGLGVKNAINSPTFNILKLYQTKKGRPASVFCHIDAYRLESGRDLSALGIEEFFEDKNTVTAIEWADKVKSIWPKKRSVINIKSLDENTRQIEIIEKS